MNIQTRIYCLLIPNKHVYISAIYLSKSEKEKCVQDSFYRFHLFKLRKNCRQRKQEIFQLLF